MRKPNDNPSPYSAESSRAILDMIVPEMPDALKEDMAKLAADSHKRYCERMGVATVKASVPGDLVRLEARLHPFKLTSVYIAKTLLDDSDLASSYLLTAFNKLVAQAMEDTAELLMEAEQETKKNTVALLFKHKDNLLKAKAGK
jgi:DNA-binding protein YbaB